MRGSRAGSRPMHPRSREPRCSVTNAPPGWWSASFTGKSGGKSRPSTAPMQAHLATSRSSFFSQSASEDILRLFFRLHDYNPAAPLLNTEIDLAPEHLEIVDRRPNRAQNDQPH